MYSVELFPHPPLSVLYVTITPQQLTQIRHRDEPVKIDLLRFGKSVGGGSQAMTLKSSAELFNRSLFEAEAQQQRDATVAKWV